MSNISGVDVNNDGIPRRCGCGGGIVVYTSTTDKNPYRQFFRCEAYKKPNYEHMFKWVDESMCEELEAIREEQRKLLCEINDRIEVTTKKAERDRATIAKRMTEIERGQQAIVMEVQRAMKKGVAVCLVFLGLVLFKQLC